MWVLLGVPGWLFFPWLLIVPISFMALMIVAGVGIAAEALLSERVHRRMSRMCGRMITRMMEHMPDG